MSKVDEAERRVDAINTASASVVRFYLGCWIVGQVIGHLTPPVLASILLTVAFAWPWSAAFGIFFALLSVMPMRKL